MSAYAPDHGYTWNPLKPFRNIPCPCQSGKKAKRCCGQFEAVPIETAEVLKRYLKALGHLHPKKVG